MTGGLGPAPFRYGTSRHGVQETILKALNEADGTALTTDVDSYNYAENFAVARALADLWSANRRLAYQWDPLRMTDFLGRWETILDLHPTLTATDAERRAAVGAKLSLIGKAATRQVVYDLLVEVLGDVFVEIVYTDSSDATGAVAGGITVPGGVTLPDGDWSSSIAYLAIHVEPPTGMTDAEFYETAGRIYEFLDGLLPAWVDFAWYRNNSLAAKGFLLDDPHNLDNEAFSV